MPPRRLHILEFSQLQGKWESLYVKMKCMHIFGEEFIELLEIMERFASSSKQQVCSNSSERP